MVTRQDERIQDWCCRSTRSMFLVNGVAGTFKQRLPSLAGKVEGVIHQELTPSELANHITDMIVQSRWLILCNDTDIVNSWIGTIWQTKVNNTIASRKLNSWFGTCWVNSPSFLPTSLGIKIAFIFHEDEVPLAILKGCETIEAWLWQLKVEFLSVAIVWASNGFFQP